MLPQYAVSPLAMFRRFFLGNHIKLVWRTCRLRGILFEWGFLAIHSIVLDDLQDAFARSQCMLVSLFVQDAVQFRAQKGLSNLLSFSSTVTIVRILRLACFLNLSLNSVVGSSFC